MIWSARDNQLEDTQFNMGFLEEQAALGHVASLVFRPCAVNTFQQLLLSHISSSTNVLCSLIYEHIH